MIGRCCRALATVAVIAAGGAVTIAPTSAPAKTFWTNCAIAGNPVSIHAHGVQCGAAHAIIGKALAKGQRQANSKGEVVVNGFVCRTTGSMPRPILCVEGSKRIRAPMP